MVGGLDTRMDEEKVPMDARKERDSWVNHGRDWKIQLTHTVKRCWES